MHIITMAVGPDPWQCGMDVPPKEELTFQLFSVGQETVGSPWKHNFGDMISNPRNGVAKQLAFLVRDASNVDIWFDCRIFTNPKGNMYRQSYQNLNEAFAIEHTSK